MQVLLQEFRLTELAESSDVALMGPTDRGDAISGIIEDLKHRGVLTQSIVGKTVSASHPIQSIIERSNQPLDGFPIPQYSAVTCSFAFLRPK